MVDQIMVVELVGILFPHPRTMDVGLVGKDERGGHGVDWFAPSPVIVAVRPDRPHDDGDLRRVHPEAAQDRVGEHCSRGGVPVAGDAVADVVHVPRDLDECAQSLIVIELAQGVSRDVRHEADMAKTVFSEAKHTEAVIGRFDQRLDLRVVLHLLE